MMKLGSLRLVATGVIVLAGQFLVSPAHADDPSFAWFGYEGSSRVADAVAESIIQGNSVDGALALAQSLSTLTDDQTLLAITDAIVTPPDLADPETTVTSLLDLQATAPDDVVGGDLSLTDPTSAVPATSDAATHTAPGKSADHGRPPTVEPYLADQTDNGEKLAINYYAWLHRGQNTVRIYFGSCTYSGCSTTGYINESYDANTYFSNDFYAGEHLSPGSVSASFSNYKIRLRQDINNWPDSTASTYSCSTSGYAYFSCVGNRAVPNSIGNW